jgi:pyruvate,water dikinase
MEDKALDKLLIDLKERTKELNCLYEIDEIMGEPDLALEALFQRIVKKIPAGWQYPDICGARIVYGEVLVQTELFRDTAWVQHSDILVQDERAGRISICYTEERPIADEGPFLKEERRLINAIADRLKHRILHNNLKVVLERQKRQVESHEEWPVILDLIKRTDSRLLSRISRKMLNHLAWTGFEEAHQILERISPPQQGNSLDSDQIETRSSKAATIQDLLFASEEIFRIAGEHLSEAEILAFLQKWIKEDRSGFLTKILETPNSSLADIAGAIKQLGHLIPQGVELSSPRERSFRVSLIQRLLNDDLQFVQAAKQSLSLNDFSDLLDHTIYPAESHGRLGGKGAGLFVASKMLKKCSEQAGILSAVKIPKTWHITSDSLLSFINYNDLEEIFEHRYKDIGQVRQEHPSITHIFKSASFPPEIIKGLSIALDDFAEVPLIVRSSSLLEDTRGTSFAGKYKSLFVTNQGTKSQRLAALMDAVAEVYASTFGPDPIGYRMERGLIDFHEEMGVLIQEVVGTKIGQYYMPAFAGLGSTQNEFQCSRRIRREDGILRMVPGLGTRAVDRVLDDYPIVISPGQPSLRLNATVEEKVQYSPKRLDALNLKTGSIETIEIEDLFREHGDAYPMIDQLVSILEGARLVQPSGVGINKNKDTLVVTFEGLFGRTQFIEQASTMLRKLQSEYGLPLDIEFAHDGTDLYLLQCRPQSHGAMSLPAVLPGEVPRERILFSANRYVTNGTVSGITHIVYIDPVKYSELQKLADLEAVGQAIAKLNRLLPKRRFIFVGPERWGSRGDIRLGVSVSYSDINNTAMLIEIASKHKDYVPELSFGTSFFQDLVEASICYLPLYPDDWGTFFNETFFANSPNRLPDLLPEFAHLAGTVRVIDVPNAEQGMVLNVLMNGEMNEALAFLAQPSAESIEIPSQNAGIDKTESPSEVHWRWRMQSVEEIGEQMDADRFGVKAMYLFGSTKNATAGPESDIDLLIHFAGDAAQKKDLLAWLDGWSLCLSYMNYLKTGCRTDGLLNIHLVSDQDIQDRTSYAVKIGSIADPALPIPIGRNAKTP